MADQQCRYLSGINIKPSTPADGRALIGKKVTYLMKRDVDQSGRGYFFPRNGVVAGVIRRNIAMDTEGNFIGTFNDIVEMTIRENGNV